MEKPRTRRVLTVLNVLAGSFLVYVTVRILIGPDTWKTARMAVVRYGARSAKSHGERWTSLGNQLDTLYWQIAQP